MTLASPIDCEEPAAQELAASLGAKRNGKGWRCRCPAHDDHDPSLDISVGEDGRTLFICRRTADKPIHRHPGRPLW